MSKTLNNILTVFKVVRIIAKVVFILCIIGGVGSLLGFLCLPLVGGLVPEEILLEEGVNLSSAYLACIVGVITCAGEAVFAFLAEKYFKSVLDAQTPFTESGAKECFRLGIASLIISVATSIVAGIASAIVLLIESEGASLDVNTSFSLSTGLFFLFLSLIFKHGAEVHAAAKKDEEEKETQTSEFEIFEEQ